MIKSKKERAAEVVRRLSIEYADAECALVHSSPFELMIATILSAQCTDERVNIVTADLFRKYRGPAEFAAADIRELERDVHSTGFFRNKAKNIQAACRRLLEVYGGEVPQTMEDLLTLGGVARKTANVVLGNAFGIAAGVVVDTHVGRLSRRLGLTKNEDAVKVEKDLQKLILREHWIMFPHWMIYHGRRVCDARKPKCGECLLADICPSFGKFEKQKPATKSPARRRAG